MIDETKMRYTPNTVVHPGATVSEYLEVNDWSQRDLSRRTGLTPKTISEICNGKAPITPPTSLAFEKVLQRPAHFWLSLQRRFDEAKARQSAAAKIPEWEGWAEKFPAKDWEQWAAKFPISDMKRYMWVDPDGLETSRVESLLRFFGVSSPDSWKSVWEAENVAFRQTRKFKTSIPAISAWVRATEIQAAELEFKVEPFNEQKLLVAVQELRAATRESAEDFVPKVQALCAAAGVAVVWVPELKNTGISGCARWLTDSKALIGMTLRYKNDDQIWFTFFHEVGHILLHRKKYGFILDNADEDLVDRVIDPNMQRTEEEANRFAADTLIPPNELTQFLKRADFSEGAIHNFADRLRIGPGLVVGRLQREGILKYFQGQTLKRTFEWEFRN